MPESLSYEDWLRAEVEAAPPLSDSQIVVLSELFGGDDA